MKAARRGQPPGNLQATARNLPRNLPQGFPFTNRRTPTSSPENPNEHQPKEKAGRQEEHINHCGTPAVAVATDSTEAAPGSLALGRAGDSHGALEKVSDDPASSQPRTPVQPRSPPDDMSVAPPLGNTGGEAELMVAATEVLEGAGCDVALVAGKAGSPGSKALIGSPRVVAAAAHVVESVTSLKAENLGLLAEIDWLKAELAAARSGGNRWRKKWAVLAESVANPEGDDADDDESGWERPGSASANTPFDPFDLVAAAAAAVAAAATGGGESNEEQNPSTVSEVIDVLQDPKSPKSPAVVRESASAGVGESCGSERDPFGAAVAAGGLEPEAEEVDPWETEPRTPRLRQDDPWAMHGEAVVEQMGGATAEVSRRVEQEEERTQLALDREHELLFGTPRAQSARAMDDPLEYALERQLQGEEAGRAAAEWSMKEQELQAERAEERAREAELVQLKEPKELPAEQSRSSEKERRARELRLKEETAYGATAALIIAHYSRNPPDPSKVGFEGCDRWGDDEWDSKVARIIGMFQKKAKKKGAKQKDPWAMLGAQFKAPTPEPEPEPERVSKVVLELASASAPAPELEPEVEPEVVVAAEAAPESEMGAATAMEPTAAAEDEPAEEVEPAPLEEFAADAMPAEPTGAAGATAAEEPVAEPELAPEEPETEAESELGPVMELEAVAKEATAAPKPEPEPEPEQKTAVDAAVVDAEAARVEVAAAGVAQVKAATEAALAVAAAKEAARAEAEVEAAAAAEKAARAKAEQEAAAAEAARQQVKANAAAEVVAQEAAAVAAKAEVEQAAVVADAVAEAARVQADIDQSVQPADDSSRMLSTTGPSSAQDAGFDDTLQPVAPQAKDGEPVDGVSGEPFSLGPDPLTPAKPVAAKTWSMVAAVIDGHFSLLPTTSDDPFGTMLPACPSESSALNSSPDPFAVGPAAADDDTFGDTFAAAVLYDVAAADSFAGGGDSLCLDAHSPFGQAGRDEAGVTPGTRDSIGSLRSALTGCSSLESTIGVDRELDDDDSINHHLQSKYGSPAAEAAEGMPVGAEHSEQTETLSDNHRRIEQEDLGSKDVQQPVLSTLPEVQAQEASTVIAEAPQAETSAALITQRSSAPPGLSGPAGPGPALLVAYFDGYVQQGLGSGSSTVGPSGVGRLGSSELNAMLVAGFTDLGQDSVAEIMEDVLPLVPKVGSDGRIGVAEWLLLMADLDMGFGPPADLLLLEEGTKGSTWVETVEQLGRSVSQGDKQEQPELEQPGLEKDANVSQGELVVSGGPIPQEDESPGQEGTEGPETDPKMPAAEAKGEDEAEAATGAAEVPVDAEAETAGEVEAEAKVTVAKVETTGGAGAVDADAAASLNQQVPEDCISDMSDIEELDLDDMMADLVQRTPSPSGATASPPARESPFARRGMLSLSSPIVDSFTAPSNRLSDTPTAGWVESPGVEGFTRSVTGSSVASSGGAGVEE